ncbi:hypothetical protein B0T25DRAFT_601078 [Lasiosphaeria hispida]|uniref:Rhomboid family membrane protein n=1 Tax=Lasiosphaeria hispida TaxID=260671 RepID=A0AAJ0HRE9_9PEZI|nr:hypothetical protein B0T25DRAFT_601078 [Lasiosphaeria hispida]
MAPQENPPPAPEASSPPSSEEPSSSPAIPAEKYYGTPTVFHNAAIAVAILGPVALLLPGRTRGAFNVQNAILSSSSFWALNQLAHDYTGQSIIVRSNERWTRLFEGVASTLDPLPSDRARRTKALMEAERVRREAAMEEGERRKAEEARRERARAERGVIGRLWLGDEEEGWQKRRLEKEKEALESGKSYWDLIVEQMAEVWGSKKEDEGCEDKKKTEGKPEEKK